MEEAGATNLQQEQAPEADGQQAQQSPRQEAPYSIDTARAELQERGWTVLPSVVRGEECEAWRGQVDEWLALFKDGAFPTNINSLIQGYGAAHLGAAWEARLRLRPVFAELWNTDKLLTSTDGIAVGRPPERGHEKYESGRNDGLHCDQKPERRGLHAYQGALYLEAQEQDDWCFKVISHSHKLHQDYFRENPRRSPSEFHKLTEDGVRWYEARGCQVERVAVPKGGLMLWDSRLIHAGARPLEGRCNKGRWRYIFFICQTPAIWVKNPRDLQAKRSAYEQLLTTRHWPGQGAESFPTRCGTPQHLQRLPAAACTPEARRLAGVDPYNYSDGQSNGPRTQPKFG